VGDESRRKVIADLAGPTKYFERTKRVEFIDAIEDHDVDQHALSVRASWSRERPEEHRYDYLQISVL
jgi:hypothetical protein